MNVGDYMKRYLIAVDSFKGSMSSIEIGETIKEVLPNTDFIPIADGGEGSLDVLSYINPQYKWVTFEGADTYLNLVKQHYLINGDKAYIESALICGFTSKDKDILNSSSYGIGLALKDAFQKGIKHIYLFLGGTGSNDGGMGLLSALGYQFNQNNLRPTSKNMIKIHDITMPKQPIHFESVTLLSDVNNPLLGEKGATYIFGPQKGGNPEMLNALEKGMENWAYHINHLTKQDNTMLPGAGAAGGSWISTIGFDGCNNKIWYSVYFKDE